MSEPDGPEDDPPVALEPDTLPEHPLRAQDVPALLFKEFGIGDGAAGPR